MGKIHQVLTFDCGWWLFGVWLTGSAMATTRVSENMENMEIYCCIYMYTYRQVRHFNYITHSGTYILANHMHHGHQTYMNEWLCRCQRVCFCSCIFTISICLQRKVPRRNAGKATAAAAGPHWGRGASLHCLICSHFDAQKQTGTNEVCSGDAEVAGAAHCKFSQWWNVAMAFAFAKLVRTDRLLGKHRRFRTGHFNCS